MSKSAQNGPRAEVTFQCRRCKHTFTAAPERIEDAPEFDHHPWRYFASCPRCEDEVEQAPWERALIKAWGAATGPRTDEGKAAAAANLQGHPTPEESRRTRFNAMKHGLAAKTASYFPAKPDGYSFCSGCEVNRAWCGEQSACVKKTELFMLHQAAFEQRDPKHLMGVYSDLQAGIFAVLQQILQTIIADGVKLSSPKWYTDKNGEVLLVTYVDENAEMKTLYEVQSHPLFKPLGELLSRTGLSLADMGMTVKVLEGNEDEGLGQLREAGGERETPSGFRERALKALENLADKVERANQATARDPVLIEHNRESGGQPRADA